MQQGDGDKVAGAFGTEGFAGVVDVSVSGSLVRRIHEELLSGEGSSSGTAAGLSEIEAPVLGVPEKLPEEATVDRAHVDTLQVSVQVIRIGKKQCTQAVFKQLPYRTCPDIKLAWGRVVYQGSWIVWQDGGELCCDRLQHKPEPLDHRALRDLASDKDLSDAETVEDRIHEIRMRHEVNNIAVAAFNKAALELPQLFIAV